MTYTLTNAVTRRRIARAPTAYAAGLLAREHVERCRKAGFRLAPFGLNCKGKRVPKGSADWFKFEAGLAGLPEPVDANPVRGRFVRSA